jgi:hypothetical protein
MGEDTPQTRTLRRALAICGSIAGLARSLNTSVDSVAGLLAGTAVPTAKAYIAAIDIVATNDCKPKPQ